MNLWLYSLRELVRRPARSLLTLLSIVLGVATVFAVSSTIGRAQLTYSRMTDTLAGQADAQVTARGGGRFAEVLIAPLKAAPQVRVAVPLLRQPVVLRTGKKQIQINGVGAILAKEQLPRPFEVVAGRVPNPPGAAADDDEPSEMALEESLAQSAGIKTGDEVRLLTPRQIQRVRVVGLVRPTEVRAFAQGGLAYFNLEDWQWLCKADGKIDALEIKLATSSAAAADRKKTLDALARRLPPNLQLRSDRDDQTTGSVTFTAFQYGLEAARTLALLVVGLLILKDHSFRVAGTSRFYLAGGMGFFVDRRVAERHFGPLGSDALLVVAKPAEREALGKRLRALCDERGLLFQTYAEVQDRLDVILNRVVASLWVLLALGFLIAVFGVTNTLMMNVLEQTREIGLMRVLGMQRRQIRRMVLAQCCFVGILAIVPGFGAGVSLAYIIRSSSLAILGENPQFGVLLPWLVPYGLGLLFLILLVGWLPAARGARLNILEAIRTE